MRVVLALLVCGLLAASASIDKETKEEFHRFLKEHGRNYTDPITHAKREAIFAANKLKRAAHNIKFHAGEVGWEEEVNEFSDKTVEEFIHGLGFLPSNETDNDGAIPASEFFGASKRYAAIDWRQKGKVGPVKNQGRCGSCWAFSAVAVMETCVATSLNTNVPDLSEQQLQDCLSSKVCSPGGGNPSRGIDLAKQGGVGTEQEYPYVTANGQCHTPSKKARVGQRISGRSEDEVARMLSSGVVSVALDASPLHQYKSGVIDAAYSARLSHAVTTVAISTDCGGRSTECWVIKNSWGARWGEQGYFRLAKGKRSLGMGNQADTATGCTMDGAHATSTSSSGGEPTNPTSTGSGGGGTTRPTNRPTRPTSRPTRRPRPRPTRNL